MSEQRKYTLDEIDRMRDAVEAIWMWGPHDQRAAASITFSRVYQENEKTLAVEQQLRTYMANGTDPHELSVRAFGEGYENGVLIHG